MKHDYNWLSFEKQNKKNEDKSVGKKKNRFHSLALKTVKSDFYPLIFE